MTKIIEIDYCQNCKYVIQSFDGWRCGQVSEPPVMSKLISAHYTPVIPSWCPLPGKEEK